MLPEQAEKMLKEYKNSVGRYGYLEKAIAEGIDDLKAWETHLSEELALSTGSKMDGMPRGSEVSRPTERIALMLATGFQPQDMIDARKRLDEMRIEKRALEIKIHFVEAWIKGLTEKEAWLIERIYFEGYTYNEAAAAYSEKYGIRLSRDGIRRMKKIAVGKIAEMAK